MSQERYTSMTRTRYREIVEQIANGTLSEKWKDKPVAITKAEKVEERQIRAIALITKYCDDEEKAILRSDAWDELYMMRCNNEYRLQILSINRKAIESIKKFNPWRLS